MDKIQLGPLADILVPAYLDTASYSKQFRDDHGGPPTLFAKVHHMRSIVQAMVNTSDRFHLAPEYSEFGRVQVLDETGGRCYLLRSDGAVSIERAKRQSVLFDNARYLDSDVVLIVYAFHEDGMDLSIAGTRKRVGSKRLEPSGPASFIGTWAYSADDPSPFEQGTVDAFDELGHLPDEGEVERE